MKKKIRTYHPHEGERMEALAGLRLASFGRRALAFYIDLFASVLLFAAVAVPIAILGSKMGYLPEHVHFDFDFHEWYSVLFVVLYYGLATYWGNGRTLGKRICKIRVVSLVEERITLWTAIERALGYGASALEFFFGFFQYFLHPNCQTVHDRIAGTIVVDERKEAAAAGRPLDPEPQTAVSNR